MLVAVLTLGPFASRASAAPTDQDKALATALFNDGKALLASGKVGEACRKLEESRRLDPLPGTILNLAVCHEQEGLLASAFTEFREARALAERDHREDRLALADEHLRAIEPKLAMLVVVVGADADVPDLHVTRDGVPLARAAWGTRVPIDPGEHVVEVSAPNKRTSRIVVHVRSEGDVVDAVVTPLEDDAPLPPTPIAVVPIAPARARAEAPSSERATLSTRRTLALVAAGTGALGLGAGTYFGISAIQKHDAPGATCTTTPCSPTSVSLNDRAKLAADASTVSIVLGVVGLGVGAFLWFGESKAPPDTRVTVLPGWAPGRGGVDLVGRF